MLFKGYLYILVRVNALDQEGASIVSVSILKEFPDVFPEDLPIIPPECDIDIGVDLDPNTNPISISPV